MKPTQQIKWLLASCLALLAATTIAQTPLTVAGCSFEVPAGFTMQVAKGANVAYSAVDANGASIVIVAKTLSADQQGVTLYDVYGTPEGYASDFMAGSEEYLSNVQMVKYGSTLFFNTTAFWIDYTASGNGGYMYCKNYLAITDKTLYSVALCCPNSSKHTYAPVWYRFKNSINL